VIDLRDLLHEGDAGDVPAEVDGVRLCRAAARLRADGVSVEAVIAHAQSRARATGFAVLSPVDLDEEAPLRIARAYVPPMPNALSSDLLTARLDATTASTAILGNRAFVELDNAQARTTLVALIDGARRTFHAQWYLVEDDDVTRTIEDALVRAGARGVAVRVLVDSLYSLHGSFGTVNPLLERLAAAPGVELCASRPIDHVPTIEDLKQRDHRKVAISDGVRAIVSGRNLAKTYYRSFTEARLSPSSPWSDVPWLDASVALEGPAVMVLESAFLAAWTESGREPFEVEPVPVAGDTALRVVVHRGLCDAYTLEAYLALIDAARERLLVVNSFPLQLELQHALLLAMDRGVRVTVLVGHIRPLYGEDRPFGGGAIRALADTLVRARLDALIEKGAIVRELALSPLEGWDPALGLVRPSVHAKLVCADGRFVAMGSANLDVTAGYWESEALVVVDEAPFAERLEAQLGEVFGASSAIDPHDPKWREGASLRAWLGRVWPSVVG
jgi:phosphatidylserine/phosphatidylglycerophosphate/cardiolipin synthase-like enzyme